MLVFFSFIVAIFDFDADGVIFLALFSSFYCVLVDAVGTKDALAQEYLCVQFIQFGQKNERN